MIFSDPKRKRGSAVVRGAWTPGQEIGWSKTWLTRWPWTKVTSIFLSIKTWCCILVISQNSFQLLSGCPTKTPKVQGPLAFDVLGWWHSTSTLEWGWVRYGCHYAQADRQCRHCLSSPSSHLKDADAIICRLLSPSLPFSMPNFASLILENQQPALTRLASMLTDLEKWRVKLDWSRGGSPWAKRYVTDHLDVFCF